MKNIRPMRILIAFLLLYYMVVSCSGCAFVSVPAFGPSSFDLEEKTVLGEGKDKVLLMDISGTISEEDETNPLGMTTKINPVARIREELELAKKDKKIKALILKIDSPGGTVTASDIIYHELKTFKEETGIPIFISMMDVAASGGYYIAMAGDKIIAHPTTITGSIGVLTMKFDVQGLMDKIGVEEVTVKSGDMKDFNSIFHTLRPEDQALLQHVIDSLYERFIGIMVESRPGLAALSRENIRQIADGRIYTAQEALDLKLIDGIGYLEDAISLAKKEAGLIRAKVVIYQRFSQHKSTIYSHDSSASSFPLTGGALAASVLTSPLSDLKSLPLVKDLSARELSGRFWYLWTP
ncbi:MAG: signal peptide peptidase SppA [bacterium]